MNSVNKKVIDWLTSGNAGHYRATTPAETIRMAWSAWGGSDMSVTDFETELRLYGFRPDNVKNARGGHPSLFQLVLPSAPSR